MREAAQFFETFQAGIVSGLYTSAVARIETFDPVTMTADVSILPDELMLVDVPVATLQTGGFVIRMPYEKGDIVMVSFSMRDIDAIMHGSGEATDRMLDINDAIVVCGLNLFTETLPATHANALVIADKNFSSKIVMTPDGIVTIEAESQLELIEAGSPLAIGGEQGPEGPTGPAGTVSIGSTTTGAAGSAASVTNTGTPSAAILNFTIPRGNTGATGAAATVGVGTVTTGAAGSAAAVTNSGTSSAAVFNFTIPKGDKGDKGDTGATGPAGTVTKASVEAALGFTVPKYWGASATAPTGGTYAQADTWFNTTTNRLHYWDGTQWYDPSGLA